MSGGLRAAVGRRVTLAKLKRDGITSAPVAEGGDHHVLIAPANSAGQGYRWARALEQARPDLVVKNMAFQRTQSPFAYPADQLVPSSYAANSTSWQKQQFAALTTHRGILIESAQPPASRHMNGDTVAQIEALQAAGVSVALLFHGSDIRDPGRHLAAEPHSHFSVDAEFRARMEAVTARSRGVIARTHVPVFVSTPDLLDEVEGAIWLPVVIDVDAWTTSAPPFAHNGPPRVVHVPSSSHVKGTELVEPVLRELHQAGEIEYTQVSGIPHTEVAQLYRESDIVLDQFRVGNYGVAACEALATGRVTVSHVSEAVRDRTRSLTGAELPIVESTAEHLREMLCTIAAHRTEYATRAAAGVDFVRTWHDGRESGQVLADWLKEDA